MGRPKDSVFWECVDISEDDSRKLICKFCNKKFKGGASRIKIHLSGLGGNIGSCTGEVPSHIQEKALKAVNKAKRRKLNTLVGEDNNAVNGVHERGEPSSSPAVIMATTSNRIYERGGPSSSHALITATTTSNSVYQRGEPSSAWALNANFTTTNEVGGECVSDVLVRFLMSRNVPGDVIKDSNFQNLLKSIENLTTIEKSLLSFEQEMNQKMQIIKMSWKLTGCSLMIFDLKRLKEGAGEHNQVVVGFYCPRGFIFVEVSPPRGGDWRDNYEGILHALKKHDLGLFLKDVVLNFQHKPCHLAKCHYQQCHSTDDFSFADRIFYLLGVRGYKKLFLCIQHDIEKLCMRACEKSIWLQSLIMKSDKIYEFVVNSSLYEKFEKTLKQKRVIAVGKTVISISRLGLVMELEIELRKWLLQPSQLEGSNLENDITEIITDYEFWGDGNALMRALRPLLHIPQLMDTLVPTIGYLEAAIDKAKYQLKQENSVKK